MIRNLFSIYDIKAEIYLPIHAYLTKAEAIREFAAMVNDPKIPISANPEDYSLFSVGHFDMSNGKGEFYYPCVPVITALECVKKG